MKTSRSKPSLSARTYSRRHFLQLSGTAGAALAMPSFFPAGRSWADTVATRPFGRLESFAEGVWAVISTPLDRGDFTTTCNGGIVAGSERVLLVDTYARAEGVRWAAEQARELTGRFPTDVVITHHHGDHVNGLWGLFDAEERPNVHLTEATRMQILQTDANEEGTGAPQRILMLARATLLDPSRPTELDLGGRTVTLYPRSGHTVSDLSVELDDPSLVFCGDLVWNEMFPNYSHARPVELAESVRALARKRPTTYVVGHGPLADATAVGRFQTMIDHVEAAARQAFAAGTPVVEAAETYALPAELGAWHRFNANYYEKAFRAWYRALETQG